jgi:transcription termination factor Rho
MPVLDRNELEASPLADLHAIADQVGLEGFRRLRKADLINAILGEEAPEADADGAADTDGDEEERESGRRPRPRRRRSTAASRTRRGGARDADADSDDDADSGTAEAADASADADTDTEEARPRRRSSGRGRDSGRGSDSGRGGESGRGRDSARDGDSGRGGDAGRIAEGVVEVLGNGSAFLRVDPPEASDEDVYISAAQVRRCELVSGDRVSGPVRTPRRSERYPSLVRVDMINDQSADSVSDGSRYEDLPVSWPTERLALGGSTPTLEAIEWLTPLGLGSRAVIVGPRSAGKSDTLRALLAALHGREGLELSLVLAGARPEEIAEWADGPLAPAAAVTFAASADAQAQAVERAVDASKRLAARGSNVVVLIDSLDALGAAAARRVLAAARNLREGGSLTVIATASEPFGGETTVIALDPVLAASGRQPILDLLASGTLRSELLVGEDGAAAIAKARASALDSA